MTSTPAERARDLDARTAQQNSGERALRRARAIRRKATRSRAVLRGVIARRVRGRGSTGLRHALCAIGLLAMLLLAFLPAHANGLAAVTKDGSAVDVQVVTDAGDGDIMAAPPTAEGEDAMVGALSDGGAGVTAPARAAGKASPSIGWYRLAAAEQRVNADLLRALHVVESSSAPDGCVANIQGSGAVGPFQFKPATFREYGVDANNDGRRDICSFADALFSAARYLRALGAGSLDDPATRRALARYGTDPDRVLALARGYRDGAVRVD